ncbi:LysR family substrate-binding domain-containing protein [Rhizobium ruizarguesonis]|uniref:LysR family substrate-binding domain-containing protein n=1 Tax=Rhizobium ruizarguesonis TaxID=2081791 RepID=A0ACD5ENE2_9HYPH
MRQQELDSWNLPRATPFQCIVASAATSGSGISPWRTGGLLREVLRHFRSQFPRISISLAEISPMEVRHTVAMGDLDIAFVTRTGELSGCETKVLWREAIVAVMPETHRLAKRENITWDDIGTEIFVVSKGGYGSDIHDYLVARLARIDRLPTIEVHDVSETSVFDLVMMGYGITLASESAARRENEGLTIRPVAGESDALALSAVWLAGNANPAVLNLIAIADAVGRGEEPPRLPKHRGRSHSDQDGEVAAERATQRGWGISRSTAMKSSSIEAISRT